MCKPLVDFYQDLILKPGTLIPGIQFIVAVLGVSFNPNGPIEEYPPHSVRSLTPAHELHLEILEIRINFVGSDGNTPVQNYNDARGKSAHVDENFVDTKTSGTC